ncbi:MAG: cytochrome c, partial [Verrucomicrobiaceae bacterium]
AYKLYCGACHQGDGKGDGSRFPPLAGSERVTGDKRKLIDVILKGLSGPMTVKGIEYNGVMPAHDFLKNEEIAQILTYIRMSFGNNASSVGVGEVIKARSMQ